MKLSKRLFTLCLSVGFICLTMAQEASNFTLNGKVKGQNSGQVVLSYMTSKGYRQDTVSIVDGVFPTILLASVPIAITFLVFLCIATTEGSLITIPLSLTQTKVFAVPKSIPTSWEKTEKNLSNIKLAFALSN